MDTSTPRTHPPDGWTPPIKEAKEAQMIRDQISLMKYRDAARIVMARHSAGRTAEAYLLSIAVLEALAEGRDPT